METTDIINGTFSLIIVIVSFYVGGYIASRYRKFNRKTLLFVGLSWIGVNNGWWPSAISFLTTLIYGKSLPDPIYFFIGNAFIPFFLLIWMVAITELMYKDQQKPILALFTIIGTIFEIFFFYYLFTSPETIGESGAVNVEYKGFVSLYLIFILLTILITGLLFVRESLKSNNEVTKLKGKFLAVAFISYTIGAIADAMIPLTLLTLPIIRILLISSAIEFYIGWIMPERVQKYFLKRN
jgi:hypothetical protein